MRLREGGCPGRAVGEFEIDHIALVIDEAAEHHQAPGYVDHQRLAPDAHVEHIGAELERSGAAVRGGFHAVLDAMTERRKLRVQRAVIVRQRGKIAIRNADAVSYTHLT